MYKIVKELYKHIQEFKSMYIIVKDVKNMYRKVYGCVTHPWFTQSTLNPSMSTARQASVIAFVRPGFNVNKASQEIIHLLAQGDSCHIGSVWCDRMAGAGRARVDWANISSMDMVTTAIKMPYSSMQWNVQGLVLHADIVMGLDLALGSGNQGECLLGKLHIHPQHPLTWFHALSHEVQLVVFVDHFFTELGNLLSVVLDSFPIL